MISEHDELLVGRWKGRGLSLYRKLVVDQTFDFIFTDGSFILKVPGTGQGFRLTETDRAKLEAVLDAHERERDGPDGAEPIDLKAKADDAVGDANLRVSDPERGADRAPDGGGGRSPHRKRGRPGMSRKMPKAGEHA